MEDIQAKTGNLLDDELESLQEVFEKTPVDLNMLRDFLLLVNPFDLAGFLSEFDKEQTLTIFAVLDKPTAAIVLDETDEQSKIQIVTSIDVMELIRIVREMPPDEIADLLEYLSEQRRNLVLSGLHQDDREEVHELSKYAPDTAGGLMTTEFIALPATSSVYDAIQEIRKHTDMEVIHNIYLLDEFQRLRGVIADRELLRLDLFSKLNHHMRTEVVCVTADMDQEEVAKLASKYNITAIPVIDGNGRMVGVITHDDILDVIEEEREEDFHRMAGLVGAPTTRAGVFSRVGSRLPFLLVTLLGVFVIAALVERAETTFSEIFALAAFIPGVLALSGNVGLQTATTTVRGLATGDVSLGRLRALLFSNVAQGLCIGLVCAALASGAIYLLYSNENSISIIVGVSMFATISVSSILGLVIPLLCAAVKVDPALAAGPFTSTLNDMVAVTIYTTIGSYMLHVL
ncbi:MAG: magnesium transporter [Planctomycetes bacterium]|nr:magnesium transporter [Planctomycetota bacterium]